MPDACMPILSEERRGQTSTVAAAILRAAVLKVRRLMPRNLAQLLLVGVILLAGLVSLPQELSAGSVTALGLASALACGVAWLLWFERPKLSHQHIALLLPLIL